MTSKEIISGQITEMRQELIAAERKLAQIKLLLDFGADLHKDPKRNEINEVAFSEHDYAYMMKLRERMYAALR